MNTMDKEFIVKFANNYYINNQVPINDVDYLVNSYCEEFKKDSNKTQIFIALLKQTGMIHPVTKKALDYFSKKYNIKSLEDKKGKIIKYFE